MSVSESHDGLSPYLASNEELHLSFSVDNIQRGDGSDDEPDLSNMFGDSSTGDYVFGATDRRIVYLNESKDFKDIDYNHISSIETETVTEDSTALALTCGCCGGFLILAGVVGFSEDPQTSLILLASGIISFIITVGLFQDDETEKRKIRFITGDELKQQIKVTLPPDVNENIGAELSSILRDQQE